MKKADRNFDDLVNKFDNNIYGTTKGRLRHELLLHHLQEHVLKNTPMDILDAGGGTGEMACALAALGHRVTVNDVSAESLGVAEEKCREYPDTRFYHGSIQDLSEEQQYDLVVCHAVLEWVEDAPALMLTLSNLVKPGGHLSLSFYNKDAQLFNNMLYGNFHFVLGGMKKRNQVRLTPHSPRAPQDILRMFDELPLNIINKAGIRCFHDYLKQKELAEQKYSELLTLELRHGSEEPYMWLGKYFQIIAVKPR